MSNRPASSALDCVMLLPSIHFVLKAEQLCRQRGLAHDLVPVPRKISADCGMALAFNCGDLTAVREVVSGSALPLPRFFHRQEHEFFPLEG